MAAFHTSKASLIVVTLILLISVSNLASAITLFDGYIYLNNISNKTLTAACRSNGADVGTFTIPSLAIKDFVSHVLVKQRTVATCSMTLGNLHGTFDVFDWGRDKKRCANRVCFWHINELGLFLFVNNDHFEREFTWPYTFREEEI